MQAFCKKCQSQRLVQVALDILRRLFDLLAKSHILLFKCKQLRIHQLLHSLDPVPVFLLLERLHNHLQQFLLLNRLQQIIDCSITQCSLNILKFSMS
ncbi:hypothetical protein D3C72_1068720 [compost metagenome]